MAVEKETFNPNMMISQLLKSHHGSLQNYVAPAVAAANASPDFLARLITWNLAKGEIRDTKVALPVISLRTFGKDDSDLAENAIANLLSLDPRSVVKAYHFNKELSATGSNITGGHRRLLEKGLKMYVEHRESSIGKWDRVAVQHRASLKELYAISHVKPSERAQAILFDRNYPKGSVFEKISQLRTMSPMEAAGTVLQYQIPFQIALGALGRKKEEYEQHPEFVLALLEKMSGQQLLSNTKMLDGFGVFRNSMLKQAYDQALTRAKGDKRVSTLKAGKAIEMLEEAGIAADVIAKISEVQETRIASKSIEGDWLVLGDASSSMHNAIKCAVEVASYLAKSVAGKVYLVFFDTTPRLFDVTGKTLEQVKQETKNVRPTGCTSCGCGIELLRQKGIKVDGIAMISDGGDNTAPLFHTAYQKYAKQFDNEPIVYYYRVDNIGPGDTVMSNCKASGIKLETFDIGKTVDYYSLPNMVASMKTTSYSLFDEIMSLPLLTLSDVFK